MLQRDQLVKKLEHELTVFLWAARMRLRATSTARALGPKKGRGDPMPNIEVARNFSKSRVLLYGVGLIVLLTVVWNLSALLIY